MGDKQVGELYNSLSIENCLIFIFLFRKMGIETGRYYFHLALPIKTNELLNNRGKDIEEG